MILQWRQRLLEEMPQLISDRQETLEAAVDDVRTRGRVVEERVEFAELRAAYHVGGGLCEMELPGLHEPAPRHAADVAEAAMRRSGKPGKACRARFPNRFPLLRLLAGEARL
jgi:hypothetical protein